MLALHAKDSHGLLAESVRAVTAPTAALPCLPFKLQVLYRAELQKKLEERWRQQAERRMEHLKELDKRRKKRSEQKGEMDSWDAVRDTILTEPVGVRWTDIVGLDEAKTVLNQTLMTVRLPHCFGRARPPPKGLLLSGPPGTGKTLLAKAIAAECDFTFFNISPSVLRSMWVGKSENTVQTLFEMARQCAPAVIFLDEVDAVAADRARHSAPDKGMYGTLTELLAQMDGISTGHQQVLVIAATNQPTLLDPAFLRRMEPHIHLRLPNAHERRQIFGVHLQDVPHELTQADWDELVQRTPDFSGAEVATLCHETLRAGVNRIAHAAHFRSSNAYRPDITGAVPEKGWLVPCDADAPGAVQRAFEDMEAEDVQRVVPPLPTLDDFLRQMDRPKATLDPRRPLDEQERQCWTLIRGTVVKAADGPRWTDIVGLDEAKRAVRGTLMTVRLPHAFGRARPPPRGLLLSGPPGTGKTLVARAIAAESGFTFFSISPSVLKSKYTGYAECAVRILFEMARQCAPAIVFIDEVDAVAADRAVSSAPDKGGYATLTELLAQMDGVATGDQQVLVVAATNRPDILDPAFVRRMKPHVRLRLPNIAERRQIFECHVKDVPHELTEADWRRLVLATADFSGSDIATLCHEVLRSGVDRITRATHFRSSRADRPDITRATPGGGWLEPCDADAPGAIQMAFDDMDAEAADRVVPPLPTVEDFLQQLNPQKGTGA